MSIEKAKLMKSKLEHEKEELAKLADRLINSENLASLETLNEVVQAVLRIALANAAILEEILESK